LSVQKKGEHWATQGERGSIFAMKLISWIAFIFGRRVSRALLYPICLYFMLLVRRATRASQQYLARALGRTPTWRDVFQHYFSFAAVLLDRAFVVSGRPVDLDIAGENLELVRRLVAERRGCLLLSAHFGSFDVTRQVGHERVHVEVNMMMYEENARKLNTVFVSLGAQESMKVIPIGAVDSLIRARDCLDRGEWVGILADRAVSRDRLVQVPFLGATAAFPTGPFLIASALKVPVIFFACPYLGGNRYKEYFELFAEEVTLDRGNRDAQLERWVRRYAERVEHYCRLAPYNWFNFYDFWATAPELGSSSATSSPISRPAS